MMRKLSTLIATMLLPLAIMAQGWPASYGGVMLQGFYWDSFIDTQWSNLESQADELSEFFDLIWVPQSGNCNSSYNVMGYTPVYWYDHNSSFGTEDQLRSFIKTCKQKNLGVIADVVINHRGTLGVDGSWVDFPAETYNGKTWQLGLGDICIDDDGGNTAKKYTVTGAKDTGEDWNGMRDLDHTSKNVQDNVNAYLDFLLNDLGYSGFRYDMTKGYAAQYTALYNSTAKPTYSVGEYWDGNIQNLKNWIDGCKTDNSIQSATFDFATRYNVRDACAAANWSYLGKYGLASYNDYKRYAVTFIENHDTQYRSSTEPGDPIKGHIEAANAYILTMPGTPCIFLPHWKDHKQAIKQLITLRKAAGIHNESQTKTMSSIWSLYACEVTGEKGGVIFKAGSGAFTLPENYKYVMGDADYAVYASLTLETPWTSVPSGNYSNPFKVTLSALTTDAAARLVYTTDGSTPTASSLSAAEGTSIDISQTTTLKVGILTNGTVKNIVTRRYVIKPFEAHTATVYFKDPGWTSVFFYAWANDGKNTQLNGSWPGKSISSTTTTDGVRWYYQTFDITEENYSFNIIFNKGLNNEQTVDIGPINSDKYYELSAMSNGKYTVKDITASTGISTVHTVSENPGNTGIYTLNGQLIRTVLPSESYAETMRNLPLGIYIVNGKKIANIRQ